MAKLHWWDLQQRGNRFHNGKGAVREIVAATSKSGQLKDTEVRWRKVRGPGKDEGVSSWTTWRRWVTDKWQEPRPERLPVPTINDIELAFPTGKHTPPWHWVPDEFRNKPGGDYDNRINPWCQAISALLTGRQKWTDWQAIPKEGVDAEQAHRAIMETLGNWGIKHEHKIASAAYMMSEWFEDFWWKGETHSVIHRHKLIELIEGWEG